MTSAQDQSPAHPATHHAAPIGQRLAALRAEMRAQGLDGFLVPRADEYQGEYVPPSNDRLRWATGFTGSAGTAAVLMDRAAIFVDGRYTLQVVDEVDGTLFERLNSGDISPQDWLERHIRQGFRLGIDPWTHTVDGLARLKAMASRKGAEIVAVTTSPLDKAWRDRPAPPKAAVEIHALDVAGEPAEAKRLRIAQVLADHGQAATVLTLSDSIAWLFNIRGGDVPRTPFALSYALLRADGTAQWFIDPDKISADVIRHVGNGVEILAPDAFAGQLDKLGAAKQKVRIDPATASAWIADRLGAAGAELDPMADPCLLPKACKNEVELAGTRAAHLRDGAAVTQFLAWLSREAPKGHIDELTAGEKLHDLRRATGLLRDLSFDSITGAGPNGAIVHYRSSERTNRKVALGELFLIDSGGQYRDGTTDITRTIAVGPAGIEERDRFTRVLKGHITLALARFPEGTTGSQLDVLARHALWQAGCDYDHGTGHGVGSYLSVHEGPQRIAKMPNTIALKPGMILSNEPGYYKTGAYGIRVENLIVVTEPAQILGGDRPMMGFETITLAPIDRNLIEPSLMTAQEIAWLDAYHARVAHELTPLLDPETKAWLAEVTRPLLA
jgi:Xaa-Pro aminopeptidase